MMHQPVLYQEIINALCPRPGGKYVDGTLGAGGHAWGLLFASEPDGKLLGLDIDPQAIQIAKNILASYGERVIILQDSYQTIRSHLNRLNWGGVDGIVLDLGLSSMQLDNPDKGFSFRLEGPLDMRFDPNNSISADFLVNHLSERELANIIYKYGEEPKANLIARAIVQSRPISTTTQLADLIARVAGRKSTGIHPATRTFQALRIMVNQELDVLQNTLPHLTSCLNADGRLAVISFHSLEDRMVKVFFRQESRGCLCPPRQPVCTCNHTATIREITKKPIRPSDEEVRVNPRARSARLRVAERLAIVNITDQ